MQTATAAVILVAATGAITMPAQAALADTTIVTVAGTNYTPYARRSTDLTWLALGGQVDSAPSVVTAPNGATYMVARGLNAVLYVRTLTTGWARLSSTTNCGPPAVTATATQLVVACRGLSNGALHFGMASLRSPFISSWVHGGGRLLSDPSVNITANGDARFWVVGGPHASGNVWQRTGRSSWSPFAATCGTRPSAGERNGLTFGCASPAGTLTYQAGTVRGTVPAQLAGDIGLAPGSGYGMASVYAQGPANAVYRATIAPGGASGFAPVGGSVRGGAGAATVASPPGTY